jgi:hypothetical protein
LNGKVDVPRDLRKALSFCDIEEKTVGCFDSFVTESFDTSLFGVYAASLIASLDQTVDFEKKLAEDLEKLKNNPQAFLAHALVASLKVCNLCESRHLLWKSGTASLTVEVGNILAQGFGRPKAKKPIVVIPVNNTFDTEVTFDYEASGLPLVSTESLHGKWLLKMMDAGIESDEIADRIRCDITSRDITPASTVVRGNSTIAAYELGTVARIENNKAVFFLLALSEFDKNNRAMVNGEDVYGIMEKLLMAYDTYGQGLDLYLPLIGTRQSRAQLSSRESFDTIVRCVQANKSLIHGNVYITVLADVVKELGLKDWHYHGV